MNDSPVARDLKTEIWPLKKGDTVYYKTIPRDPIVVRAEFLGWLHKKKGFVWMAVCRTGSGEIHLRDYRMYADIHCMRAICTIKEAAMPEVDWNQ